MKKASSYVIHFKRSIIINYTSYFVKIVHSFENKNTVQVRREINKSLAGNKHYNMSTLFVKINNTKGPTFKL